MNTLLLLLLLLRLLRSKAVTILPLLFAHMRGWSLNYISWLLYYMFVFNTFFELLFHSRIT
jgi:hypothetical protein